MLNHILGEGVEYHMIQYIATRIRDAFVFGLDFGHWFCFLYGTFGYFDDRSALYLWKLIIERKIGTGGLLNVWIIYGRNGRLSKTWRFRRSGKSMKTFGEIWEIFSFRRSVGTGIVAVLPGKC